MSSTDYMTTTHLLESVENLVTQDGLENKVERVFPVFVVSYFVTGLNTKVV